MNVIEGIKKGTNIKPRINENKPPIIVNIMAS